MMEKTYKSKIAIRAGETYCVKVPKKFIDMDLLKVGDVVDVSIKKSEVIDDVSRN